MNIIDAVKSGLRYRRPNWEWYSGYENGFPSLVREDLLADDWEVEEPTVAITKSAFFNAAAKVMKTRMQESGHTLTYGRSIYDIAEESFGALAKELGL